MHTREGGNLVYTAGTGTYLLGRVFGARLRGGRGGRGARAFRAFFSGRPRELRGRMLCMKQRSKVISSIPSLSYITKKKKQNKKEDAPEVESGH